MDLRLVKRYKARNKIGSKVGFDLYFIAHTTCILQFGKYDWSTKYLEISHKYLKYVLLSSKIFWVQKLYKGEGKGNVKKKLKEGYKAENYKRDLREGVSHVLGQRILLYL